MSSINRRFLRGTWAIIFSVILMMTMFVIPAPVTVYADTVSPGLVKNGVLDGVKVRFRPAGSYAPLAINQDGSGSQNVAHLYYNGRSSQFYLKKADNESYYIYFYQHYWDTAYKDTGDCVLDVERTKNDDSYYKEGQVIHVTEFSSSESAKNKRWKLIRQNDGTYYIQNVRSGLYWSLNDLSKPKANNNKLIQRNAPLKWEMEIVSGDNNKLETIKGYDSLNFRYNNEDVNSTNWMGALPETLRITDISIPGTHDAGTCRVHSDQSGSSDQRYYIDELLNAGVRHLDLRTGLDDNKKLRVIHASHRCLNRAGNDLSMNEAMGWITAFLDKNPSETVILQVKMDRQGSECEKKTYEYLETMANKENSYIWKGDHVPTLGEVRGKILVISRLNIKDMKDQNDANKVFDFSTTTVEGEPALWGLDCNNWKESEDYSTGEVTSGSDYVVWSQDDWSHAPTTKKIVIKGALLGSSSLSREEGPFDLYMNHDYFASLKNSTLDRYNDAKLDGKHAWVFNYTSCSSGSDFEPFDNAKTIHRWLYDHSDYDDPDRLVCRDTFTGVMAFDFNDELMASHIYKTNFRRQYVTIHGVSPAGDDLVKPLTLFFGESENASELLTVTNRNIMRKYFDLTPYAVMTAGQNYFLTTEKVVSDQADMESKATSTYNALQQQGSVPTDLYVHLLTPIKSVPIDVEMPKCGTEVSSEDPQVSVSLGEGSGCEVQNAFITRSAGSGNAFEGTVNGGQEMSLQVSLTPNWGYYFDADCAVQSETATVAGSPTISGASLQVKAKATVPHDLSEVPETAATCEENGVNAHYLCGSCGQHLMMKNIGEGDEESVLVEVDESEVTILATGHAWGEWKKTKEPTEDEEGELTRTCGNCDEQEHLAIPKLEHVHDGFVKHVSAHEAETCMKIGNNEYWVCERCGSFFSNQELTNQIAEEDTETTVGPHSWGEVQYLQGMQGENTVVTAICECENDHSHVVAETVPASVDRLEATCTEDGHLYVSANFESELLGDYKAEDIIYESLGHKWDEGTVTKEATCSAYGEILSTCERCGGTKTEEIAIDPKAHKTFLEVDETTNTATCKESGRANQYEVCSLCDEIIKQKRITTPQLDHIWSKPVYKWSGDRSAVTATRTCTRSGCDESDSETVSTTTRTLEESSCETAGTVVYDATFENEEFDTQEAVVKVAALGHNWGEWTVTKEATETAAGEKQRVCKLDSSHIEKQTIPAKGLAPGADPNQKGTDGSAVGPGASAAAADKAITGMKSYADPKGSVYSKIKLRSTKQTKNSISLKWTKPGKATKFVLYGNKCGQSNKMKKLAEYTGTSKKLTQVAGKKIQKGTYYKFIMVALDKNNNVVSTSKVIHIATKGGKVTNPKKVSVKKGKKAVSKVTVKEGKTETVKSSVTKASKKLKLQTHRKVKYESSNNKIATVTSKGKIKGVKKGTCYIYAYAQNGVSKKVKIVVK